MWWYAGGDDDGGGGMLMMMMVVVVVRAGQGRVEGMVLLTFFGSSGAF